MNIQASCKYVSLVRSSVPNCAIHLIVCASVVLVPGATPSEDEADGGQCVHPQLLGQEFGRVLTDLAK